MMRFYDLLKYINTGIASPDMTFYDRMRGDAIRKSMERAKQKNKKADSDKSDGAQIGNQGET